jgi:NAD(P)-dependent dehydrogenase (short-subunit alcohol dehydrogenase family)
MELKKAIVTGASRGIGRGIALCLAQKGYDVAFSYATRRDEAEETARELARLGRNAPFFEARFQEKGAGERFFSQALEALGGLSLLVNNAGVTRFESILELTEEQLDFLVTLDFKNYLILAREAARHMAKNGVRGSIVNITSSRGERAYPGDGVYGGMKAALARAVQSFALDLAPYGIRINNVAPGATRVRSREDFLRDGISPDRADFWDELGEVIPLGRSGVPADIGGAVAFLASEEASYITGITLRVDGGLILPGMPEHRPPEGETWGWGRVKKN